MKVKHSPGSKLRKYDIENTSCRLCKKDVVKIEKFNSRITKMILDQTDLDICKAFVRFLNWNQDEIRRHLNLTPEVFRYRFNKRLWLSGPSATDRANTIIEEFERRKIEG